MELLIAIAPILIGYFVVSIQEWISDIVEERKES